MVWTHAAMECLVTTDASPTAPTGRSAPFPRLAAGVAIAVLLGFVVLVVALVVLRDATEITWGRLIWVFSSVEAVAFGAAGFLFGSSVQRERAEKAEASAAQNAEDAAAGRELAASAGATATAAEATRGAGPGTLGPGGTDAGTAALLRSHADLARRLFPR